jgi:hypothetical protein
MMLLATGGGATELGTAAVDEAMVDWT